MAVNKVDFGGNTLIDLTGDTVTAQTLADGYTAHNAAGEEITGTMQGGSGVDDSVIAPVESTSTASQAYAVGDLLIYNGKLYRVTAAIASGGTITPDTNCVETSVSEVFVRKTGDTMTGGLGTTDLTLGKRQSGFATGDNSVVIGNTYMKATGSRSVAIGHETMATAMEAFAHGAVVTASGNQSFASGYGCHSTGERSFSHGSSNTSSGSDSSSEGYSNTASGNNSHAEGSGNTASGSSSHVEGSGNTAGYASQHVSGKYNDNKSTSAFEVGNGTANDARSNALELTWDGDLTVSGEITDGNGNKLSEAGGGSGGAEYVTTCFLQNVAVGTMIESEKHRYVFMNFGIKPEEGYKYFTEVSSLTTSKLHSTYMFINGGNTAWLNSNISGTLDIYNYDSSTVTLANGNFKVDLFRVKAS